MTTIKQNNFNQKSSRFVLLPVSSANGIPLTIVQQNALKSILSGNDLNKPIEAYSMFGTPIYDCFTFGSLENVADNVYIDEVGNERVFDAMRLHDVIVEVNMTKNIVTRSVQGRRGTIKQYICDGDFIITLRGWLSGRYNTGSHSWEVDSNFPTTELQRLIDLVRVPYRMNVTSNLLSLFGITSVVVTDYNFPQQEGQVNRQYFEINMLSDTEVILEFEVESVDDKDKLKYLLNV